MQIHVPSIEVNHLKTFGTTPARQRSILYMSLILTGCVTGRSPSTPTPMVLPDGSSGFALHCAERRGNSSDCEAQAVKACGGLYTVVDPANGSDPTNSVTPGKRPGELLVVKCVPP